MSTKRSKSGPKGGDSKSPRRNRRRSPDPFTLDSRAAGVLLHVTSLPGPHGNGDLGPEARAFADFLGESGQRWWQMLPVNPTGAGHSPYSGVSAFAGSSLLISLEDLRNEGLLDRGDVDFELAETRVDYVKAERERARALRQAFANFQRLRRRYTRELDRFKAESAAWLDDYTLYMAVREAQGRRRWTEWPEPLMRRNARALEQARTELAEEVRYYEFEQLMFDRQWRALRAHCRERGVGLIGDAPIFIAHESADVWANAKYFLLDDSLEPTHVAGVPPDYFSKTGQLWGNPLYRWSSLRRAGYGWWIERFRTLLDRFDVVRLDHFIGFSRFWQVPATEKTAVKGRWMPGPSRDLFDVAREQLGRTPFIAEDLGEVTPEVRELRDQFGLPGMRVLQFAFGTDSQANEFLPHNYVQRSVAYTGTHDNDTFVGWFKDTGGPGSPRSARQADKERRSAMAYFAGPGATRLASPVHWEAIRVLYSSPSATAIVPMQDILGLGSRGRMNVPGQAEGNWQWRVPRAALTRQLRAQLRSFATTYGRLPAEE